jgi:hypothetical protein
MRPSNPHRVRSLQVDTVVIAAQAASTRRLRVTHPQRGQVRSRVAEAVTRVYTAHERALFTSGGDQLTPARVSWHAAPPNAASASDMLFAARLVRRGRRRLALAAVLLGSLIAIAASALVFTRSPLAPHSASSAPKPQGTAAQSAAAHTPTQPARDAAGEAPATTAAPPDTPVPAPSSVIEWLATARYAQALEGYRRLARGDARNPAYAAAAAILEHKLAQRCAQRAESGGAPCGAAQP